MSDRLVQSFFDMVRIDSESGNEAPFIEHMRGRLEAELGATCVVDDYGNLIAKLDPTPGATGDPIFLAAHADTVKPGIGIEPVLEDGVIRSKGETILGADDKGGLAAIVEAVLTAKARPHVEIVVTRSEEIGLVGAKNLDLNLLTARRGYAIDSEHPNVVIIGGPTHASLDIEVVGKAAHAAAPEFGISAIRVAADAIQRFEEGQLDEETVANVGTIEGGAIRNGVPERVSLKAETRSLNHDKCVVQAEKMKKAFEDAAADVGAQANVKLTYEYSASQVAEDAPVVELAKRAIAKAGLEPATEIILGGTDALVLSGRGIDAVVLGYGGKAAHSTDEHIALADQAQVAEILRTVGELTAGCG